MLSVCLLFRNIDDAAANDDEDLCARSDSKTGSKLAI